MCITDHHSMTLAVKVALNPNTTNQATMFNHVLPQSSTQYCHNLQPCTFSITYYNKIPILNTHEEEKLVGLFFSSVIYCDHSPSVVRPSVHNLLVNTLASTNINESSPNLVKMYMTTRARMSSVMEIIGPKLSELSALEIENLPYLTMFTR